VQLATPILLVVPARQSQLALATAELLLKRYILDRFDPPLNYFLV